MTYCAHERDDLGVDFLSAVDQVVSLLSASPRVGARLSGVQRKVRLKRFPYLLVYEIDERHDRIVIHCVSHQSRHPDYWRGRIEEPAPSYARKRYVFHHPGAGCRITATDSNTHGTISSAPIRYGDPVPSCTNAAPA